MHSLSVVASMRRLFKSEVGSLHVAAVASHHHLELTRLANIFNVAVVEAEQVGSDFKCHVAAFAFLQAHALKAFQLLHGALNAAHHVANVELNHLGAVVVAGVGHLHCGSNLAALSHRCGIKSEVTVGECGV